ncbi:MAG: hypothetical protein AVDCRST_MAG18-740 [uncultured Thermomicrobiales bacterium]|uniref:DUF6504 domain-containing protein n=1 Tax=uncultured Thermomicrobiales bacterium TaxID=1645740 RepID=A0A6J4URF8_9BACT|nr:MAG: hypothetical protein AVDCRST_MAG18-740 [uncultured Thermomicrobiales bacterium]
MTIRRFAPTRPIAVVADARGDSPTRLRWRGRWEGVGAIAATWDLTEGWWRGETGATRRRYFRLLTHSGLLCVIYRDLASGRWYFEQIID